MNPRAQRATRVDRPDLPEDVDVAELPAEVRAQLRSLPTALAERVAGHLAAAGELLQDDPEEAYRHAATARNLAARVAATREAAGLAAYAAGRYDEACRELRAYQRMTGDPLHLPVLADSERGLGRPEKAVELARSAAAATLPTAVRVEMRIVESGARRDLGQADAAVLALQVPELSAPPAQPWAARLRYAYAEALLAAGRRDDAAVWFQRAAGADPGELTDARQRLAELSGQPVPPAELTLVEVGIENAAISAEEPDRGPGGGEAGGGGAPRRDDGD